MKNITDATSENSSESMETVDQDEKKEVPVSNKKAPKVQRAKGSKKAAVKKTAKAKTAKKYAAGHKKTSAKSKQGQNGPALELKVSKMSKDEKKLVTAIYTPKGDRKPHTIRELQTVLGGSLKAPTTPARNALRRLVRAGWFEKADRGSYKLTEKGRKRGIKED
jgi:hypothetical protein